MLMFSVISVNSLCVSFHFCKNKGDNNNNAYTCIYLKFYYAQ